MTDAMKEKLTPSLKSTEKLTEHLNSFSTEYLVFFLAYCIQCIFVKQEK